MSLYYWKLKNSELISFFKYGVVGVMGLIVDLGLFYVLHKVFGVNYLISNFVSSTIAVIHNFFLNSYFTFKVTDNRLKRFVSFYLVALVGMGVSSLLLALMISIMRMDAMIAKVITIFIVAVIQYFVNKKVTFGQKLS